MRSTCSIASFTPSSSHASPIVFDPMSVSIATFSLAFASPDPSSPSTSSEPFGGRPPGITVSSQETRAARNRRLGHLLFRETPKTILRGTK